MPIFAVAIAGFLLILCLGGIFAKDDHDACDDALQQLKSSGDQRFTNRVHDEYRQALDAHASGEYKTCVDLANRALEHLKLR